MYRKCNRLHALIETSKAKNCIRRREETGIESDKCSLKTEQKQAISSKGGKMSGGIDLCAHEIYAQSFASLSK
jgi:hypothetical protein